MLYVITGNDSPQGLEIRKRVRPAHLARAQALVDEGRLVIAGPCPAIDSPDPGPAGFCGSVIIAEFPSLEAARDWIAADPYVTEGVFETHEIRPFVQVLP
ncbi:MAG TPA: YciI family protein [Steroidobacteraceae bacterium]|nr:YciI family protein [Steroidobacteraceae bacterium]